MAEHELSAERVHYTWSREHEPRLRIAPGDVVTVMTRDGFDGQLEGLDRDGHAGAIDTLDFGRIAPLSGPVLVDGAEPGGAVVVELLEVRPRGPGWAVIWPRWADFDFSRPESVGDSGVIRRFEHGELLGDRVRIGSTAVELAPMLGMIGTAPAAGEFTTLAPRDFGGNMDCRLLSAGATLYLPVQVGGALVSFGDGHAVQGDGEISTTGIECGLEVRARIDVDRFRTVVAPELRIGGYHYFLEHARELGAAVRGAIDRAQAYLIEERGLTGEDAYLLLGMGARLEISEVVDTPYFGVRLGVPLEEGRDGS